MIEGILSPATLVSGAPLATPALTQANFNDIDRFRAAMMSAQDLSASASLHTSIAASGPMPLQQPVQTTHESAGKTSLGDTILTTLQDLSTDTKQRYTQVGELLSQPNITMSELMSAQYTLLQTSLQFEIASKGISKLTQNLDSVLKTS